MDTFNCSCRCCRHLSPSFQGPAQPGAWLFPIMPCVCPVAGWPAEQSNRALTLPSFSCCVGDEQGGHTFKPACLLLLKMPPFYMARSPWICFDVGRADVIALVLQKRKLRPKVAFPRSLSKGRGAALGWEPRCRLTQGSPGKATLLRPSLPPEALLHLPPSTDHPILHQQAQHTEFLFRMSSK